MEPVFSSNAVYMLASRKHGTIYIGITSELLQRVSEHKAKIRPGFSSRYDVTRLVWFERFDAIEDAIRREKSLKRYPRAWKITLIERDNPNWDDLFPALV